jgi:hypothetical protein
LVTMKIEKQQKKTLQPHRIRRDVETIWNNTFYLIFAADTGTFHDFSLKNQKKESYVRALELQLNEYQAATAKMELGRYFALWRKIQ